MYIPTSIIFFIKISLYIKSMKEGELLSQEELRELYCDRLKAEKQCYISERTGINVSILSQFKNAKINLYPYLFEKLESYLTENH